MKPAQINAIPHDLNAFLVWLRDTTEELWASYRPRNFEAAGVGGSDWQTGTRWLRGLSVRQVLAIERRWNVKFPEDYRLFLRCLHTTDRPRIHARYRSHEELVLGTCPGFYDWQLDTEALSEAFAWPLEGLMLEVEHNDLWLESWGSRPETLDACRKRLGELVSAAPPLLPLIGHRYLVGHPLRAGNPVLSIHQCDMILYGSDLRTFLLRELADLFKMPPDKNSADAPRDAGTIPFWGEIMQLD